jgi:Ser/Thr protein kinase RdoA (MazF antagonist)
MATLEAAARTAERYLDGPVQVAPLGRGLINETFLASVPGFRCVLQRINRRVFPDPAAIMANLRALSEHARQAGPDNGLRLPGLIPTRDGQDFHRDADGEFWRALDYIEDSRTLPALADARQAEEMGKALGRFHRLASGIPPERLRVTLPGFHVAPEYLARFEAVAAQPRQEPEPPGLRLALDFVADRRDGMGVLEEARQRGELRVRAIHGDPKLDNVLFDAAGRHALCLVDLDTVQPGLIHYDIGDCLRSCCNRAGEAGRTPDVAFDLALCRSILKGYLDEARGLLTAADREYLYASIRLLPLELGLRFLTDHLEGDVYFKVEAPGQNLERSWTQFRLAASVERQEAAIRGIIAELA